MPEVIGLGLDNTDEISLSFLVLSCKCLHLAFAGSSSKDRRKNSL